MSPISIQSKEALRAFVIMSHEVIHRDVVIEAQNLAEADAGREQVRISEVGIFNRYEGIVAHIRQAYQATTEQAQDRFDAEHEVEEKEERSIKLAVAKDAKRIAEAERRRHYVEYDWSKYKLLVALEVIGFIAEGSYNVFSMSVGGGSLLFSIAPAFVVAIALCAFAIYLGTSLKGKSSLEKKSLIRKFAPWMVIVFLALAVLRSFAVLSDGQMIFSAETLIGAAAFVVIQALIFAGAVIIAMHLPSKEDRLVKKEHDRLTKDILDADTVIAACRNKSETASHMAHVKRKERIDLVGEQTHLEQFIDNLYRQSISAFYRELTLRKPRMTFDSALTMPLFQNNQK